MISIAENSLELVVACVQRHWGHAGNVL